MKVVILAGGFGTRISEESYLKPKPMIEIGEMPILWHIMKIYSAYGFNEFIICAGYKQYVIKEWFANYFLHTSDITFDFTNNSNEVIIHNSVTEHWKVTIVDTGLTTQTGGRVKRIQKYIGDEPFLLTYGDAVGNVNIKKLIKYHKKSGKIGTISVYGFGQNKGVVEVDNGEVVAFREKSSLDSNLINIGFMIFEPRFFNFIDDDTTILEKAPMEKLIKNNELAAFVHEGYWQCMDTLREKQQLENLWNSGSAPWKIWND